MRTGIRRKYFGFAAVLFLGLQTQARAQSDALQMLTSDPRNTSTMRLTVSVSDGLGEVVVFDETFLLVEGRSGTLSFDAVGLLREAVDVYEIEMDFGAPFLFEANIGSPPLVPVSLAVDDARFIVRQADASIATSNTVDIGSFSAIKQRNAVKALVVGTVTIGGHPLPFDVFSTGTKEVTSCSNCFPRTPGTGCDHCTSSVSVFADSLESIEVVAPPRPNSAGFTIIGDTDTTVGPTPDGLSARIQVVTRMDRIRYVAFGCRDEEDNDGDGLIDLADPGCSDENDSSEWNEQAPCDDGIDNDNDGSTDFMADLDQDGISDPPGDPGCMSPESPREDPECQDGVNNDLEPGIDFDGGESVWGMTIDDPDPECRDMPWLNLEAVPEPSSRALGMAALLMTAGLAARMHRR